DVALLDIDMPGFSGIEVMAEIRRFAPAMKILVLSGIDRPDVVDAALAAGANGYLLKDFVLGELQLALATVTRDESYLSPKIQQQLISSLRTSRQGHPSGLTPRQQEILRLVASGRTTKEIARDLGISPKTVEFHRAQLMEKLGIHEVAGLTRYAMQQGLI
ncbi:MAG TPA: response regulator transcription factor, partial [Azospira sp.]|nr:response regulator transcription factor [Azospira sp.]